MKPSSEVRNLPFPVLRYFYQAEHGESLSVVSFRRSFLSPLSSGMRRGGSAHVTQHRFFAVPNVIPRGWCCRSPVAQRLAYLPLGPRDTFDFVSASDRAVKASERPRFFNVAVSLFLTPNAGPMIDAAQPGGTVTVENNATPVVLEILARRVVGGKNACEEHCLCSSFSLASRTRRTRHS